MPQLAHTYTNTISFRTSWTLWGMISTKCWKPFKGSESVMTSQRFGGTFTGRDRCYERFMGWFNNRWKARWRKSGHCSINDSGLEKVQEYQAYEQLREACHKSIYKYNLFRLWVAIVAYEKNPPQNVNCSYGSILKYP